MGNKQRGIIDLVADGATYQLHFTANAMCELEAKAGDVAITEFMAKLQADQVSGRVRMSDLRLLIWAGLTEHHPGLTLQDAGRIIGEIGGMGAAMAHIDQGLAAASGPAGGDGGNGAAAAV